MGASNKYCFRDFGRLFIVGFIPPFLSSIESIRSEVIILSGITFFILWASLIIIPFLSKRGWLVGGTYLALTVLFYFWYEIKSTQL